MGQIVFLAVAAVAVASCSGDFVEPALEPEPGEGDPPGAEDPCTGEGACGGDGLCDAYDCGGQAAAFNHFGCPRVSCDDDGDCPSGEGCFVRAYAADCLPSSVTCTDEGDVCSCAETNDCGGVTQAHCLPTEFYPKEGYCPITLECDELTPRREALATAQAHHAGAGHALLADELEACLAELDALAGACP